MLQKYPEVFATLPRWSGGMIPGDLGTRFTTRLNSLAQEMDLGPAHYYLGLDSIAKSLDCIALVKKIIGASCHEFTAPMIKALFPEEYEHAIRVSE